MSADTNGSEDPREFTTIRVSKSTAKELKSRGDGHETYEQIVRREMGLSDRTHVGFSCGSCGKNVTMKAEVYKAHYGREELPEAPREYPDKCPMCDPYNE